MRTSNILAVTLLYVAIAQAQTFSDFLTRVNIAPSGERAAIVDSFMQAVPSFPYVERDTIAHFLYRGSASSVTIPGDANEWNVNGWSMFRLSTTDLWYYTRNFESNARLDYKYVLNGSNWITDPRNGNSCTGGFGPNSELRMPLYVPPPEVVRNPNIPHGTLRDTVFASAALGNSRRVRIYTPPGYDSSDATYGVILFHDGLEYISLGHADNVLDNLIAAGRIQPVIAVFVPPVNRTPEYAGDQQDEFTSFIVSELMPYIDAAYSTVENPGKRAVLGASYGGNISLWIAYSHPAVFGCVAAQSSYIQPNLFSGFQNGPLLDLQLYLDMGTYDIGELIPLARNFAPILEQRGYTYHYAEYPEGHSWCNWRARVDDALEMFFAPDSSTAAGNRSGLPADYELSVFPNPFNSVASIRFSLPKSERIQLTLFDVQGRQVMLLDDSERSAGQHTVTFTADNLASGVYFARLSAGSRQMCEKILFMK